MSRPRPHSGRSYLRLALVPVLCGLLVLSACKGGGPASEAQAKNGEAPKEPDAVPVEVAKVSHRPVAASYSGTAALEALGESQVVAKTSGVALAVLVEEGQVVRAGQALVRLDPDRLRLQVAQAEAQMRKLENNYRRAQQLVEQQMISANDVDQIKYDLENARAIYRAAALELSYTTVTAPISGVVASRSIKSGNFVQINTPIIRIDYDQRADALVVPRIALLDDGDPAVFAVRNGKASRVPVKVGYVDGEWIEVREGLKAGEQVVTAGKVALREGSAVQVIGAEPAKVAAKADDAKTAGSKQ